MRKAFTAKKGIAVWKGRIGYTITGVNERHLLEVEVREPITPERWWIIKCKEHVPCANHHCHEEGCEFYEAPCEDAIKEFREQQQMEMAAERANEEVLYKYELPRW